MKCVNENCANIIIDFTGNTDGRCGRCRLLELFMYFGSPRVDVERVSETTVDKQSLIDSDRSYRDYE